MAHQCVASWDCPSSLHSGTKVERISPYPGHANSWRSNDSSVLMGLKAWAPRGTCHWPVQATQSRLTWRTQEGPPTLIQEGAASTEEQHSLQVTRDTHGLSQTGHLASSPPFLHLCPTNTSGFRRNTSYSSVKLADLPSRKGLLPRSLGSSLLTALTTNTVSG